MKVIVTAALIAAIAITAAACGPAHVKTSAVRQPVPALSTNPVSTYTAPAPAPSPDGKYSGSCDVSLSSSVYGQDYLTADIRLENTGNIGTITRATVRWGQQGFSPIKATKTVRLPAGRSKTVHFHYAATTGQISRFQDVQLTEMGGSGTGDGCRYRATNTGTFGSAR